MDYLKWISFGRKEKSKDDIASVDNIKNGSKLGKRKGSILRRRYFSPMTTSSQYTVDTCKDVAIGSTLEIPGTKTSIAPPNGASLPNKRKSWYGKSSKKSEGCKPSSTNQDSPRDQTGALKDLKVTTRQSTKHTRKEIQIPKTSSENLISIIVTSPTSDCDGQEQDWSFTSNRASSLSLSSLSSTSSLDTTRLMPPSTSTPISTTQRCPKSNEAPEVKKWLIGCMNRKADTLPRKLIYRMMDIYNIKENELDPKMLEKLREGIEDEGVVFQVDVESGSDSNKKEEFNGVEALQSLRTSFRSQVQGEGKEKRTGKNISGHLNDTITTKLNSKSSSSNNNNNTNNHIKPTQPKVVPGTNPRVWQNPSSRSRNWPTTNINTSHGVSFPFPPYTHSNTHPSTLSKQRALSSKNNSSYLHSVNGYSKRGKRGSTISLSSIPEHGVSVGFDVYGFDVKGKGNGNGRWEQRTGRSRRASWDVGGSSVGAGGGVGRSARR
ncbi:bfdb6a8d-702c-41ca-b720-d47770c40b1f [Sclerotinia trifoliorum]|uniref:Bfdb6a8d-702c-41ca-b720-d47770c40b1f n=1 Tax=Sclerotinia trifoliorum TaxID=28548 RepID=A0A8H2ZKW6_9HELO|nr:bfdb6a8d-702c-41ca-b720-d47770c40b1f [Sclerotinia trifoliorum]